MLIPILIFSIRAHDEDLFMGLQIISGKDIRKYVVGNSLID